MSRFLSNAVWFNIFGFFSASEIKALKENIRFAAYLVKIHLRDSRDLQKYLLSVQWKAERAAEPRLLI